MIAVTGDAGHKQSARTLPFNRSSALLTPTNPDDELLAALRSGDRMAAERLVSRYGDRAYRLAMGITRNAQDAEEAVQDAFWSVVRKVETFRGQSSLGSWIYRIVVNAAYQKLRTRARRRDDISLDDVLPAFDADGRHVTSIEDWSAAVDDPAVQSEVRTALEAAIADLPVAYRAMILLHDVGGVPLAVVARSVAFRVGSAKTRAHRARLILRKRLANVVGSALMAHRP